MYYSYGLGKREWNTIKEDVISNQLSSEDIKLKYELNSKKVWFLFEKLLQGKYNHLYKREALTNPKVGDYVYCDYEGFGRGTIKQTISEDLMLVKFDSRELNTMCSSRDMCTIHDKIKRKITRL